MFTEETYSGTSPFIYHAGLTLEQVPGPSVNEDFFRRCMLTGRINPYSMSVFEALYEYGFLNRRMLCTLLNKPPQSVKECLRRLTKYGFVVRYYFTYNKAAARTASFYALSQAVRNIMTKNHAGVVTNLPVLDAVHAIRILSINQFIVGAQAYTNSIKAIEKNYCLPSYRGYVFRAGYGITVASLSGDLSFIPFSIRRVGDWERESISRLRTFFGAKSHLLPCSIPLCICEDLVHVRQLQVVIGADDKLKNLTVLYTTDVALAEGEVFSKLIVHESTSPTGEVTLAEAKFSLVATSSVTKNQVIDDGGITSTGEDSDEI